MRRAHCRNAWFTVGLAAVVLGSPALGRADRSPADRLLGSGTAARTETFDDLVTAIEGLKHPFEDGLQRLGIEDWKTELERTKRRFLAADTEDDVYYAVLSLVNSLHDYHLGLCHPQRGRCPSRPEERLRWPEVVGASIPLEIAVEYEGAQPIYVVARAADARLKGARVERVRGREIGELQVEFREWFRHGNSPERMDLAFADWLTSRRSVVSPLPEEGEEHTYELSKDGQAVVRDFVWQRGDGRPGTPPHCQRCVPSGDYVSFPLDFAGLNYCVHTTRESDLERKAIVRLLSFTYGGRRVEKCLEDKYEELSYRHEIAAEELWRKTPEEILRFDQRRLIERLRQLRKARYAIVFDARHTGGGKYDPEFFGYFAAEPYSIPLKRFYFGPVFADGPLGWRLIELSRPAVGFSFEEKVFDYTYLWLRDAYAEAVQKNGKPGGIYSRKIPFFCKERCLPEEAVYDPSDSGDPLGPVAILTGPGCASACDVFVATMKNNGLAKLVGMPTSAADGPFRVWRPLTLRDGRTKVVIELTTGISTLNDSDEPLEANPPGLDVLLRPTPENRGSYLRALIAAVPE